MNHNLAYRIWKGVILRQPTNLVQTIDGLETFLICGDFNGHIGKAALGYEGIHGGYGFGKRNVDGERILKFAVTNNLVVGKSKFVKKDLIILSRVSLVAAQGK